MQAHEIVVLVLVDEIRKIEPVASRSAVLDCLCGGMQRDIYDRLPTMVVVSCLDINSLFSIVTARSQRPLLSLPVYPCPADGEGLGKVMALFEQEMELRFVDSNARKMHVANFRYDLYGTGGHYRSMEKLWTLRIEDPSATYAPPVSCLFGLAVLHCLIIGEDWVYEADKLVAMDGIPKTVDEIVQSNLHGVFYRAVNADSNRVAITVAPAALRFPGLPSDYGKSNKAVVALLQRLTQMVAISADWLKTVEALLPLSELLHAYMWLQGEARSVPPTAEDLYGKGHYVFNPWSGESAQLEIQSSFKVLRPISVITSEQTTHASGDELLKKVLAENALDFHAFAFPSVSNYPSIEGVVPRFIFGKHHAVQMKMRKTLPPKEAVTCLKAVHGKLAKLGSLAGSYLAVLYTTTDVKVQASQLPPGSLLVGPGGLVRLLQPLGISPVLQELEEKANTST